MKQEEILTNNTLIAFFIGEHNIEVDGYVSRNKNIISRLKYHSSWDWLMPVVEKIFNITDEDTRTFSGNSIFELGLSTTKEIIYQAVIEFIKWYNTQNNLK